jgi:trehalose/maltose transport system substrate-binding protein
MYTIANGANSAVAGKFDVTALPAAQGQKPSGTLGGWQLGVSRFSRNLTVVKKEEKIKEER